MSDIKLSVGLDTKITTAGIGKDIQQLLKNLESTKPKIRVGVELDPASINKFNKEIAQIVKASSLASGKPVNISIGNLDKVTSQMREIQKESVKTQKAVEKISKTKTESPLSIGSTDYLKRMREAQKLLISLTASKQKYASQEGKDAFAGLTQQIEKVESLMEKLRSGTMTKSGFSKVISEINLDVDKYVNALKNANQESLNSQKSEEKRQALLRRTASLLERVKNAEANWTKAKNGETSSSYKNIQEYAVSLERIETELRGAGADTTKLKAEVDQLSASFSNASATIKNAGENTQSLGDHFKSMATKFSSWFSVSQMIMFAIRTGKQMIHTVTELDSAMTELKKVTDESDATYGRFLENAVGRAKSVGASVKDVVNATADYARLGYNLEDASKLADTSIIYKNVADGLDDISEASASIISTMQAFKIEASDAMSIVDKFNNVSNNFAISSAGIGEAMQRSAAAMHSAGNNIDETIALITAANTVVQNPESVGTSLKTASMYLRAAKTEAEDAGESTEGMAESVSKLRDELMSLTGNKLDIQIDKDNFKSTYQILKELSSIWGELTDISKANILSLIGGKRNANVMAALLENFDIAEEVLKTSKNSEGSAIAENEKYLDSIAGKMDKIKASFEELSTIVINSDFIKTLLDAGNGLMEVLNGILKVTGVITPLLAGAGITAFFKNLD